MLLVRICAGGDGKPPSLPRLNRPFFVVCQEFSGVL